MSTRPTTYNKSNLAVGSMASAAGLALGIFGTLFIQGNLVSTRTYTAAQLINNTQDVAIFTQTGSTATGGLVGGVGYNTVAINSPKSSTNAPLNGISSGTGVVNYIQIDVVAPQKAGVLTCSIGPASTRGTGGTVVINKIPMFTGQTIIRGTGAWTMGPTQAFHCNQSASVSASFNIKALLKMTGSRVEN